MTVARRLVPGQTHAVVRRCAQRCAFLKGSGRRGRERVQQILLYSLGLAQLRCPYLRLHAFMSELSHFHLVATDARGESCLARFMRELDGTVARALNAYYGRGENLWAPGSYDNVEAHSADTIEEQLLYTWTQCVKDGLHPDPDTWPYAKFLPEAFGKTFTISKPDEAFFGGRRPADWEPTCPLVRQERRQADRLAANAERARRNAGDRVRGRGRQRRRQLRRERSRRRRKQRAPRPPRKRDTLPEQVTITISPPPGYETVPIEEVRAHFRRLLDERVAQITAEREAEGLTTFKGLAALEAQDPRDSVGDTWPTFSRNPRLAGRDPQLRLALIRGLQRWRAQYREALLAWIAGDRAVRFPLGSYWLPTFHGAQLGEAARSPPLVV